MSWKKKIRRMNQSAAAYQAQQVRGQYDAYQYGGAAGTAGIGGVVSPTSWLSASEQAQAQEIACSYVPIFSVGKCWDDVAIPSVATIVANLMLGDPWPQLDKWDVTLAMYKNYIGDGDDVAPQPEPIVSKYEALWRYVALNVWDWCPMKPVAVGGKPKSPNPTVDPFGPWQGSTVSPWGTISPWPSAQVATGPGIDGLAPTAEGALVHAPSFPSTYIPAESGMVVNTYALYLNYQTKTIVKSPMDVGNLAFNKLYGPTLIAGGIVGGKIPAKSQAAGGWDGDWAPWIEAWWRMVNIAETYVKNLKSQGWSANWSTGPQRVK